jgi:DNA processing protein
MTAAGGHRSCDRCLRRGWLLRRLAGHLDRERGRIDELVALGDEQLLAAVAARQECSLRAELQALEPEALRLDAAAAGLEIWCRCAASWPAALSGFDGAPVALYIAGAAARLQELAAGSQSPEGTACREAVAVIGTRRPSPHGLELARALGRGLSAAGLTVVSGMALGIDAAALTGALEGGGRPIAVLPAGAERPYPASHRALYRRILASGGAAVSELPPGSAVRRWMFPARNRLIAGLAAVTVIVEASSGSGALLTAAWAGRLRRLVGAVPGRVGTRQAEGPNELLARGALVVRGAEDVLDHLFGPGSHALGESLARPRDPSQARLLAMVEEGFDTTAALAEAGVPPEIALPALAELELAGFVRRGAGGRFVPTC